MSIKEIGSLITVTSQMDLPNTSRRNLLYICFGIKVMIVCAHVDVIHIKQNAAISLLSNLCDKLPLRHRRMRIRQITRHILDQDLSSKSFLNSLDLRDHQIDC